MSKPLFQDIIRSKSGKNISSNIGDPKRSKPIKNEDHPVEYHPSKPVQSSKHGLWLVAFLTVIFLIFSVSSLFSSAQITVIPKEQDISLSKDDIITAEKNANAQDLSFSSVILKGEDHKDVTVKETKEVETMATGLITLFNSYSGTPQMLLKDTRLEGSNGKIYKLIKKTTVPGMAKDKTPGSVDAAISAWEPGQEYNSAPLDFKIVGFAKTSKYEKIIARSKGDISGGFKGLQPVIAPADLASIQADLDRALWEKLLKKARAEIPDGFILYENAAFFSSAAHGDSDVTMKGDVATISAKGVFYGLVLNREKLTKKIAGDLVKNTDSDLYIHNLDSLVFSLSNKDSDSFADAKNITFSLSGTAKLVWNVDVEKLKNDFVNVSKQNFNSILSKYPNIASATLSLHPFWRSDLPEKEKDIKITVNYPK